VFLWQARVYWEDTDAGGIVYYANYLKFLERARSEWLRARGISQRALALDPGVVFSVVSLEAQYRRPARLEDEITISCEPALNGGASLAFGQHIWRGGVEGELLLHATVRVACLDVHSLKPRRLPAVVVNELRTIAKE
jgi:tol-pal system-associated acyl-CoA thioesterase